MLVQPDERGVNNARRVKQALMIRREVVVKRTVVLSWINLDVNDPVIALQLQRRLAEAEI